jgi:hypothetical protein
MERQRAADADKRREFRDVALRARAAHASELVFYLGGE